MFMAYERTSGRYASGETKLVIALRILAAGDSNDQEVFI